jgi:2-C-methyl-D-erythritol 4-phosphate cytidylyltransferase / 2-C-methyl-D-erythritol 2,4-cyclodiphosphate synthase
MNVFPPAAALVVAAGRGQRLGGTIPKQYRRVGGRMVLAETLAHLGAVPTIRTLLTLIHPDDADLYAEAIRQSRLDPARLSQAEGGATRQGSVLNGLEALAASGFPPDGLVLIHDAARPFASETVLLRALIAAVDHGAAIPVLPVADTLATLDGTGKLTGNPDRGAIRVVQTPQAFRFGLILDAHRRAAREGRTDFTDDAGVAAAFGHSVASFAGDPALFKITLEADLARVEQQLAGGRMPEIRAGIGYDVHAFTAGDHVILGGIPVPHSQALLGHSDADPVLHAITDALLGTIGDGDIGSHFPPSDPQWRGASSDRFLLHALQRVIERGGSVVSVDCTIICEAPKIGPHRPAMQARIGEILGLPVDRVGVKATTSEKLGFTGRKEGVAVMAVASVRF